jgi:hypothetical protein
MANEEVEIRKQTFLENQIWRWAFEVAWGQLFAPEFHTPQGHQEPEYILDQEQ